MLQKYLILNLQASIPSISSAHWCPSAFQYCCRRSKAVPRYPQLLPVSGKRSKGWGVIKEEVDSSGGEMGKKMTMDWRKEREENIKNKNEEREGERWYLNVYNKDKGKGGEGAEGARNIKCYNTCKIPLIWCQMMLSLVIISWDLCRFLVIDISILDTLIFYLDLLVLNKQWSKSQGYKSNKFKYIKYINP